jgi:hypothetical protein
MTHKAEGVGTQALDLMIQMIQGSWLARAIHVVVSLSIADLLRDGPKRSDELAEACGANAACLHRVMRALASQGIFQADECGRFSLTCVGAMLRTDVPGSLHGWASLMLGKVNQEAWSEVLHTVRTGCNAFSHRFGMDLWQYGAEHREYAKLFDAAMAGFTMTYIKNLLASYEFSSFKRIVDVGGGDGSLLIAILQENPEMRGIVFDLPHVIETARARIEDAGLSNRCIASGGDAFVEVPAGGDAYILSRVIHDWDDESTRKILANCRRPLPPGGRILIVERAMPEDLREISVSRSAVVSDILMTDLNMMVMTCGRERTATEYRDLCGDVGLDLIRIVQTQTAMNVMEVAQPPGQ